MGKINLHSPVKLFAAITFSDLLDMKMFFTDIEHHLSKIEFKSGIFNFSEFTGYYQNEMGENLQKQFLVFEKLIDPEELPGLKRLTNEFEQQYAREGKRLINIDPGYVCESKLILATTKNYSHRIYLGKGIYGDVHLCYQKHSFQIQPWTYPDYRQEVVIKFFNQIREQYLSAQRINHGS